MSVILGKDQVTLDRLDLSCVPVMVTEAPRIELIAQRSVMRISCSIPKCVGERSIGGSKDQLCRNYGSVVVATACSGS